MYRFSFFFLLLWFILLFRILMWSAVDFPAWPPAWASVILISSLMRLLRSLSNTFPILLAKVMPLSLLHSPFSPFPLYILIISPFCHSSGIFSSLNTLFIISRYIALVALLASMNTSFGMVSGPVLFFLFSLRMHWVSSSRVSGCWFSGCLAFFSISSTVLFICSVHCSWLFSPSLA